MERLGIWLLSALALVVACGTSHSAPGTDAGVDAGDRTCGARVCTSSEVCCTACTPDEGFCQTVDLPCPAVSCIAPVTTCAEAEGAAPGVPCEGTFECAAGDGCCTTTSFCDAGSLAIETFCLDFCPPMPGDCEGRGPADCLAAGCVPTFDDACCPTCDPVGGCGDCTDPTYFVCRPFEDACEAAFCSRPAEWGCTDETPDCSTATAVDEDSCNQFGCVPAVGPVGSPELPAVCVPITAGSCAVFCRSDPPECPGGTTAEGDGSCYTGLCIPAFVCE